MTALLPLGTLPQPWHTIGNHAVLPVLSADERARLDAITHLNHFLAQEVVPVMRGQFEESIAAAPVTTRAEAWQVLERQPRYRLWSHLRRRSMEMRQRRNLETVIAQRDRLAETSRAILESSAVIELDESLQSPEYLADTHAHLMPGGYLSSLGPHDVTAGAAYEASTYSVVPGRSGPHNDGAGRAIAHWLKTRFETFRPRRILDLGCGAGLNTCAVAKAFPQAQIVAIDAGPSMLRYAAARASSLGITNVRWVQANIENIPAHLGTFDLAFTAIVLHETSHEALKSVFKDCHRILNRGGLTLHVEQPPYHDKPWFEQCMRDWDGRFNNERFWSRLYELDLQAELRDAGFDSAAIFLDSISAVPWNTDHHARGRIEDYGRTGNWQVVGAWKEL